MAARTCSTTVPEARRQPSGCLEPESPRASNSTQHTFAHEIGHIQGASHNPEEYTNTQERPYSYGHGLCNAAKNWRTVMSYNTGERCKPRIQHFSTPLVLYQGTATGDHQLRNVARVINETAVHVANFRQATMSQGGSHSLPFVPRASNTQRVGFARIINNSNRAGSVSITAIDDDGQSFGPVSLSLQASGAAHFNSHDLENGNVEKGLQGRVGPGNGDWRLVLTTDLEIEPLAYIRTTDGFVTNMHEVATETEEGSNRYHLPFFNPGRNRGQRSSLRLINPGSSSTSIEITGVDDSGRTSGPAHLTLGAGRARLLSANQIEDGGSGLAGGLGTGTGKWRLSVSANHPIQVMSLLSLPSGHLTNLSRGKGDAADAPPPPPPPPPGNYGAYAGDVITGCRGFAWGIAVNRRSAQEALSAAVGECQSRGGSASDCNRYSNSLATGRCVGMAYGRNPGVDCGSRVWTANSVSGAESAAMTDCRVDFSVCIIPSDARGRASGCNAQGGSGADRAEDTPVLQLGEDL